MELEQVEKNFVGLFIRYVVITAYAITDALEKRSAKIYKKEEKKSLHPFYSYDNGNIKNICQLKKFGAMFT